MAQLRLPPCPSDLCEWSNFLLLGIRRTFKSCCLWLCMSGWLSAGCIKSFLALHKALSFPSGFFESPNFLPFDHTRNCYVIMFVGVIFRTL